jgi:hypothetical protein
MFCPNCAAKNLDGASFCRVCGANISLIPGALSGQLPQARQEDDVDEGGLCATRRRRRGQPSIDSAVRNAFMGMAFLGVAIALAFTRMGTGWWFWMLIPAFSMMGTGVAQYMRYKENQKQAFLPGASRPAPAMPQRVESAPQRVDLFPSRNTGELVAPPPSVTEGTTRHLGAEAPTRHFDESN